MKRPTLKISYNAPVTITFALLSLIALILNGVTDGWTNAYLFSVYHCSLTDPLAWVRFFGHLRTHRIVIIETSTDIHESILQ